MKIRSVDIFMLKYEQPFLSASRGLPHQYGRGASRLRRIGPRFYLWRVGGVSDGQGVAPLIIGMDPLEHEVVWAKLFHAGFWTKGNGDRVLMPATFSPVNWFCGKLVGPPRARPDAASRARAVKSCGAPRAIRPRLADAHRFLYRDTLAPCTRAANRGGYRNAGAPSMLLSPATGLERPEARQRLTWAITRRVCARLRC